MHAVSDRSSGPNSTDAKNNGMNGKSLSIGVTSLPTLRACPLAVALGKFPEPPDRLPAPHPFAILGTLYHDFLERVARGEAGNPIRSAAFLDIWLGSIQKLESEIHGNPDSVWLPLATTSADLERVRLRAFRAALRLAVTPSTSTPNAAHAASFGAGTPRLRGPEVAVKMTSGGVTLRGKIDMVVERDGALQIIDYKTGAVLDDQGGIKAEYIEQLQIYAGMLEHMGGGRADLLTLVDRVGAEHAVSVDWVVVRELVLVAKAEVQGFEANWPKLARTDRDIESAFQASPSDEICSHCSYRHRCSAHRSSLEASGRRALGRMNRGFECTDVFGRVEGASPCSLGWSVRLITSLGPVHLRGRMPREPQRGDRIHAFGVAPGPSNPAPDVADADDFIVPRWGVVQIHSDDGDLPDG